MAWHGMIWLVLTTLRVVVGLKGRNEGRIDIYLWVGTCTVHILKGSRYVLSCTVYTYLGLEICAHERRRRNNNKQLPTYLRQHWLHLLTYSLTHHYPTYYHYYYWFIEARVCVSYYTPTQPLNPRPSVAGWKCFIIILPWHIYTSHPVSVSVTAYQTRLIWLNFAGWKRRLFHLLVSQLIDKSINQSIDWSGFPAIFWPSLF